MMIHNQDLALAGNPWDTFAMATVTGRRTQLALDAAASRPVPATVLVYDRHGDLIERDVAAPHDIFGPPTRCAVHEQPLPCDVCYRLAARRGPRSAP